MHYHVRYKFTSNRVHTALLYAYQWMELVDTLIQMKLHLNMKSLLYFLRIDSTMDQRVQNNLFFSKVRWLKNN